VLEQVKVANCAGANADAVTELALGLMLACDRRIVPQDQMLKRSTWAKGSFGDGRSKGLKGRVLGIVGFGRIGRRMSELGQALGMRIVAWSRSGISAPPPGVQSVDSLTALAEQSDVVSVHAAPGADGPLLEGSFFSAMKEGAIFVNVARGGVVDEEALLAAVKTRSILVGKAILVHVCVDPCG
jgi:D-3-phosphoglycerate dehydrogenase